MLISHEINNLVMVTTKEDVLKIYGLLVRDCATLKSIYQLLESYEKKELDIMDLADELEAADPLHPDNFKSYTSVRPSIDESLNSYFTRSISTLEITKDKLENVALNCIDLQPEALQRVKNIVYHSLAGLLFYSTYEFHYLETIASKDANDIVLDEIVYQYYSKYAGTSIAAKKLALERIEGFVADSKVFKMKLDIFDEYPEKEDAFITIVGPLLGGIDTEKLTIKMVDNVLRGEWTAEQLLSHCAIDDEDDSFDDVSSDKKDTALVSGINAFR